MPAARVESKKLQKEVHALPPSVVTRIARCHRERTVHQNESSGQPKGQTVSCWGMYPNTSFSWPDRNVSLSTGLTFWNTGALHRYQIPDVLFHCNMHIAKCTGRASLSLSGNIETYIKATMKPHSFERTYCTMIHALGTMT